MRAAILSLIGTLAAIGCSRTSPITSVPTESTTAVKSESQALAPTPNKIPGVATPGLRIATYNINWGNANLDAVVDAIRQCDADVVCLQETNPESERVLQRAFRKRYPHTRSAGDVDVYFGAGFAVLSSLPIVKDQFLPPKHGIFGTCFFEVESGGHTYQIVSVHLQPVGISPQARGTGTVVAVLAAFPTAEEIHAAEMKEIMKHVRTDVPCVIVGDFNSCSTFKAPKLLAEAGYVDSFAAVTKNADDHPTWHWPTKFGDATLRIDYIFHPKSLRTKDCRIIKTEGSDHYLVVSDLEVFGAETK